MIYRFGPFELDDAARELRRDGEPVDAEPKAFDLLLYLLQHRDRAVSKDELQTALWPRSIVTEASLTRCVMKARRAVGDDASEQSIIRTLHSHGYRFVAELEPETPAVVDKAATGIGETATMKALRQRWKPRMTHYVFAFGVVLLVALAIVLLKYRDPTPPVTSGVVAVLPIENRVEDPKLSWVRVGLMSLLSRMLEDAGIDVAAERTVLRLAGESDVSQPPGKALLQRIRQEAGAGVVLSSSLDLQGGLYRLGAIVTYGDGHRTRRVIVGDSPAALAADMARVIAGVVSSAGSETVGRFAKVSTDPFTNEMYARALDLELQGKYQEARNLFQVAAEQEPELFYLRYEIALCTRDLREWESAEAQFAALHQEALDGDDRRALVAILNSSGVMYFVRNDYDAAENRFLEALDIVSSERQAAERATVNINLALIAARRGNTALSKQYYDQALQAYQQAGIEASPNFNNNYAGLLLELGYLAEAQEFSEKAVEGFQMRGERRFEAPSLNRLAKILRRRGDIDGAIARHEQAMQIYQELGDSNGMVSVMTAMTGIYLEKGDLTRARLNASQTEARAAGLDDQLLVADTKMQSADVAAAMSLPEEAIASFEAARQIFENMGDATGLRDANRGIALAALEMGDTARALSIAQMALERARAAENVTDEARARWLLGKIALTNGQLPSGITHFRAAVEFARDQNNESLFIESATGLAGALLDAGDMDAAELLVAEVRPVAGKQHDFMRLDARLADSRDDQARAVAILTDLRALAGEAWTARDEAVLVGLRLKINGGPADE